MSKRNIYLTYKRDTSQLLYWIINTSNGIVQSAATGGTEYVLPVAINTTGQSTVSEILDMSELIAKYVKPVPSAIYRLFQAVINARTATHEAFQRIVSQSPDPEIERSNATHKHFIDALTKAFDALGGNSWAASKESTTTQDDDTGALISPNPFSSLSLGGGANDEEDDVSSDENSRPQAKGQKKKASGKGKKGKRGKKSRQKKPTSEPTTNALADVPVESYRIIEDKGSLVSEYLLAVYAVTQEWSKLRSFTQDIWREVAYDDLNGAVAATLTSMAVAMVQQTCIAVFKDFPGHESYDTIIQTLTRGDVEKAQGQFSVGLYRISPDGRQPEKVQQTKIDIKEQLWINTYNDMVDFITDFQKNRSGKPTKAMQAQISDWDPNFDLQRSTKEQRLHWRRSYTINWLYDLVNVFSSIVVQRNTMKGEKHVYEDVDWSTTGPWHQHVRLYGLNEFAGFITALAFQKPNTDIRQKIFPHHVFQLQCVVDSLTASRGWVLSALRGHVVNPPARHFRPRRDVDLFLDRRNQRKGQGLLQSIDILQQLVNRDEEQNPGSNQQAKNCADILSDAKIDFINWLGESKYMHGLTNIPPSRFSKHNANGLWEYSPLLCATCLVEGLVLVQKIMMLMWDRIPEPTLALHLHNMLVKKGYLRKHVGLYATLEGVLDEAFFPGGVPDSNFHEALNRRALTRKDNAAIQKSQAVGRDPTLNVQQILDVSLNTFFKTKSELMMYYDANWIPERVPESAIRVLSALYMIRVSETKTVTDPLTGETLLEETELVKRAKAKGIPNAVILQMASIPKVADTDPSDTSALLSRIDALKDYKTGPNTDPYNVKATAKKDLQGAELLELLRLDIFADVSGNNPLSSFNYVWITVNILMLFMEFESRLRAARHPLYVRAYENAPAHVRRTRRAAVVMAVIAKEDDAALKIFAEVFEKFRIGALACIFWEDLREEEMGDKKESGTEDIPVEQCSVM